MYSSYSPLLPELNYSSIHSWARQGHMFFKVGHADQMRIFLGQWKQSWNQTAKPWQSFVTSINFFHRPFLSYLMPLCQKWVFVWNHTCMKMCSTYSRGSFSSKSNSFSYERFCRRILLKLRHKLTWIWPIIAELRQPKGPPNGAPYPYRNEKKTNELIFLWLSWLAVLLVGMIAPGRQRTRATWRQNFS